MSPFWAAKGQGGRVWVDLIGQGTHLPFKDDENSNKHKEKKSTFERKIIKTGSTSNKKTDDKIKRKQNATKIHIKNVFLLI